MDPLTQLTIARTLVDFDSTTGREGEAGAWLVGLLRGLGWDVGQQPVAEGRFNIFATCGAPPAVVLSTHYDCVPPFFPAREEDGRLHGRGSCDAKGILSAQIAAAERLRAAAETRIGLLFVVGEERGSEGARVANPLAPGSRFLINGEPTDNRLASATRGVYRVKLRATGRAAHSSQPGLGESAIEKLVDALVAVRAIDWPADPDLGETFYVTGLISGGIAPNVMPPAAEAELMFRTVGESGAIRERLESRLGSLVAIEDVIDVPPVRLKTVAGFETAVFSFTTDIPFLDRWGAPLLLGPGSIVQAHTADEFVEIPELVRAVDVYEALVRRLLDSGNGIAAP